MSKKQLTIEAEVPYSYVQNVQEIGKCCSNEMGVQSEVKICKDFSCK